MNYLYLALEKSLNWKGFVLFFLSLGLVGGSIGYTVSQIITVSGHGILDFEFGHSVNRVNEIFGAYGEEGMALYQRVQLLDLVNPLIYSWVTAMLLYLLVRDSRWSWMIVFALLPGLFDYAENYFLYQFLVTYPAIEPAQVGVANVLSLIKQASFVVTLAVFVFAGVQKLQTRRST